MINSLVQILITPDDEICTTCSCSHPTDGCSEIHGGLCLLMAPFASLINNRIRMSHRRIFGQALYLVGLKQS